ncbi:unnamed protein product [Blepharisma stoltei]|uniref:Uncharacterized protein n=1 Tax=Blepharisma stoltei TaxID=1481888 RepID=A0AAU9JN33_9CILI|nr:unnamed protein product [Blepharisma stoltei]
MEIYKNMGVCAGKQSSKANHSVVDTKENDPATVQEERRKLLIVKAKKAPSLKLDQNALYNRRRVSKEITSVEVSQLLHAIR